MITEHDLRVASVCDWLVDLGPGAGAEGGRVINQGSVAEILTDPGPAMPLLRSIVMPCAAEA